MVKNSKRNKRSQKDRGNRSRSKSKSSKVGGVYGTYNFTIVYQGYNYDLKLNSISITTYLDLYRGLLREIRRKVRLSAGLPDKLKILILNDISIHEFLSIYSTSNVGSKRTKLLDTFKHKYYLFNELTSDKTELSTVIDVGLFKLLRSTLHNSFRIHVYLSDARKTELITKTLVPELIQSHIP